MSLETERRSQRPIGLAAVVLILVAVGGGVAAGAAWRVGAQADATMVGSAVVLLAGVVLGLVSITRYWAFLLVMIAIRSGVDMFLPEAGGGTTDTESLGVSPTIVIGVLFLASSWAWLVSQRLAGRLYPLSVPSRWGLAFVGVGLVGVPISISPSISASSVLKSLALVTMLVVTEQIFRSDPGRLRPLLVALGASLVIPVITGLGQLSGAGFVDESIDINRIHGSFVHPNALSTYAAIMLAYALALRSTFTGSARVAVYAAGTAAGFLLLYSYGRAAWIGGLVAILVVGVLRDRRLLVTGAVGMTAIFLLVPSVTERLSDLDSEPRYEGVPPNSLAWRMDYWERVLDAAEGRPILGIGLDSVPLVMDEELQAHNSVVQAYAEMGLLGLVALLGFVLSTIFLVRRGLDRAPPGLPRDMMVGVAAAAASVLAQLLSENMLTAVAPLWYLMAGLGYAAAMAARPVGEPEADGSVELPVGQGEVGAHRQT